MRRCLLALLFVLVGCSAGEDGSAAPGAATPSATASTGTASTAPGGPAPLPPPGFDQALHDELIAMLERDQSGRSGGPDAEGDAARTARLAEILGAHGWPTYDLVGEDGEDAAWAIAQHSDQDPAFQRRALELLGVAVEAGQASPGNLAYLTDRVAVGAGEAQTYGTQVGCGPEGPIPATPLVDDSAVDQLRAEAGLPPYAEYLAEMEEICAADG